MWSSIESLKQNLNKIALDVHDEDDDGVFGIHSSTNGHDLSFSDRRSSHSFAHSNAASRSPLPNGIDSPYNSEIEQYKAEIRKVKESESEIKALSVNYAALLKEKEDQISRLNQENGSLRQNLDATKEALNVSRSENSRVSTNSIHAVKGSGDQSPNRQHRSTAQAKNRFAGNQMQNGKQDGISNGNAHVGEADTIYSRTELKNLQVKEKELADLLEEKNRSLEDLRVAHELQIKQLRLELEKERDKVANSQLKLQEEHKLNESFQEELKMLKMVESKTSLEMSKMCSELNEKISEIRQLQIELGRREDEDVDHTVKGLKRVIAALEKENTGLKIAKNELEATVESINASSVKTSLDKVESSGNFPGKEELELSLQKLEKDLKEMRHERDKALQQLARLKQHLLEKESEDSEKMDEDSKIIEELRTNNEYQRAQILKLEKALKQAIAYEEEVKMTNHNDIQKSKEIIEDLNKKLANCMMTIDSKNVELLNLQTALGQYFAEIEAKEHLEQNLALAREETAKLSKLLNHAEQGTEALTREKEEILVKLSQSERTVAEVKNRVNKLEEDNAKLRRVLEQSMTRLNRMSVDSDYLVDRRIVIKLLVTYFQRNHSKEVLDLMVRMLGFSDEDKNRIGFAQQGGRGVVRGVLGLPGRLVGGILGGNSAGAHATSEDQSFADLWVDFLLKETVERERRESAEDVSIREEDSHGRSPIAGGVSTPPPPLPNTAGAATVSSFSRPTFAPTQSYGSLPIQGNLRTSEHPDSEFSTVPLTSSDSMSRMSRLLKH
ncbi:golgin candidate 4 isoform X2 [Euphorbia lathyris]|uniref:golgin candidate 4 isoform X2 n=1 Tax=Euphorbia lathyris TaxID=212925 RepID=UPI0033140FD7